MKRLVCTLLLALMTTISTTAFASSEGITYEAGEANSVSATDAKGKNVVLIKNKDTNEIVYVNQTDSGEFYSSTEKFLLKNNIVEGAYTIQFNGMQEKTFHIGMSSASGDVKLTKIDGDVGEITNADGTKNIGYVCHNASGTFTGVVIKIGDKYYGTKLNVENFTVDNAAIAIQINGITSEEPSVWLTGRNFELSDKSYSDKSE